MRRRVRAADGGHQSETVGRKLLYKSPGPDRRSGGRRYHHDRGHVVNRSLCAAAVDAPCWSGCRSQASFPAQMNRSQACRLRPQCKPPQSPGLWCRARTRQARGSVALRGTKPRRVPKSDIQSHANWRRMSEGRGAVTLLRRDLLRSCIGKNRLVQSYFPASKKRHTFRVKPPSWSTRSDRPYPSVPGHNGG